MPTPQQRQQMMQMLQLIRARKARKDPSAVLGDSLAAVQNRLYFGNNASPQDSLIGMERGYIPKPKVPLANPSAALEDSVASWKQGALKGDPYGTQMLSAYNGLSTLGKPDKPFDPSVALGDSVAKWTLGAINGNALDKQKLGEYRGLSKQPEKPKSASEIVSEMKAKEALDYHRKYGKWKPESESGVSTAEIRAAAQSMLEMDDKLDPYFRDKNGNAKKVNGKFVPNPNRLTPEDRTYYEQVLRSANLDALNRGVKKLNASAAQDALAPAASEPALPAGIPAGSKKVGKHKTTGKIVWKSPDGTLWTE